MPRAQVKSGRDPAEVVYPPSRFALLRQKRERARAFLERLPAGTRLFGSVARGDVRAGSDIDLAVPFAVPSFVVEVSLGLLVEEWNERRLVQATPNSVVKALWDYGEVTVSLPLTPPTALEEGFARFGGSLDLEGLREGLRVPGVDKRLMLIEPTRRGHTERSVAERVEETARLLGVDADVIRGRIRVLSRRSKTGRTGVYLTHRLRDDESPEQALDQLKDADPAVRRVASG